VRRCLVGVPPSSMVKQAACRPYDRIRAGAFERAPLWTPALRRAVIRARPEFFGWSPAERERNGVALPKADAEEIDRLLLTFDPKIVRLRKRRKVIIHKDATGKL
jgi:hypothetical protein